MTTTARPPRLLPRLWLAPALLLAACSGTPGAPTTTSLPASAAAPSISGSATPTTSPADGLSIASILGKTLAPPAATSWIRTSDPAAPFSYEVPASWSGHAAYPWEEGGQAIGTVLAAGPDPTKLATDFTVPGVAIGVSANPSGLTARQVVEADNAYAGTCTEGPVQDASEAGATASFRLWESCAGGTGYLLVLAIVPADGQGLIAIVFQGATESDLGHLEHIAGSLEANEAVATPGPAETQGGSSQLYAISMDACVNQHGQGVAEGLIRNEDTLVHSFRIVVAFTDPNGVLLNDTWGTTPDVPPGVTARWQAVLPSGLPSVSVSCQITGVEIVR